MATPRPIGKSTNDYFMRVDVAPHAPGSSQRSYEPVETEPPRRRRRRRVRKRPIALWLLLIALGGWFAWASQRPGGVSGTVNGFIEHLRGDVEDLSGGRGLKQATQYYNDQYAKSGAYPVLNENQMATANIGFDITVLYCNQQAVVLQTVTVSRLLVEGDNYGDASGRVGCPSDYDHPDPWKAKN